MGLESHRNVGYYGHEFLWTKAYLELRLCPTEQRKAGGTREQKGFTMHTVTGWQCQAPTFLHFTSSDKFAISHISHMTSPCTLLLP